MNIYQKKSIWKVLLVIAGILILIVTLTYSYYLASELAKKEDKEVQMYAQAMELFFTNRDLDKPFGIEADIIMNPNIPVILEDELGNLNGANFGEDLDKDPAFLLKKKRELLARGFKPIEGDAYATKIYYTRTKLYRLITYYPYIQILLVASFIWFGYIAFMRSRREEQNRLWAGMAKETAHQLGTPISALIAWLENLKLTTNGNMEQEEIIYELGQDIDRLELIADRFSKIGSIPELEEVNFVQVVNESGAYMVRRASKNVVMKFPDETHEPVICHINVHLFQWVIENLVRNSLDAMDGKGTIEMIIYEEGNKVCLDVSDTGKGIPSSKINTIFQPGYTTKSRGWGLGLSLVKRIIKQYHKGRIYVKKSKIGEGTTFTIELPK